MRSQLEGSHAIAEAVALCRPQVVPAYPISPQTHIVEGVGRLVREGRLSPCEFVTVESEFGAMSVAIGSSAAGARTYTATASQGLLFMVEAVYNASGLGLPIVMTIANRAIGAPINIWNDQSDSMSQRDSGWVQLYAADNQAAVDLHVQAFRIAEEVSLPVMVCVDGFVLTHAVEAIELPTQEQVDAFLPPFVPRQLTDPYAAVSIGAMVGPEAYTEVRYLQHQQLMRVLDLLPTVGGAYEAAAGRPGVRAVEPYRTEGARTVVVALGSVLGTLSDAVDDAIATGRSVGMLGLTCCRPFPAAELAAAVAGAERVVVLERAFSLGGGGIVSNEVRAALTGTGVEPVTVVAGFGGRSITQGSLAGLLADADAGALESLTFLDLDQSVIDRELAGIPAPALP